jgi:hypothetical protein
MHYWCQTIFKAIQSFEKQRSIGGGREGNVLKIHSRIKDAQYQGDCKEREKKK